jgi:hypothetical protein
MRRCALIAAAGAVVLAGAVLPCRAAAPPKAVLDVVQSKLLPVGRDPLIVEAVRQENRQGKTLDQIKILDEGWRATDGLPDFMRGWIDSDCGKHLQEIKASAPYYTILWVTDNQGANVAMTDKAAAYWFGDDPCYKKAFTSGGDVYVSDVQSDSIGRSVVTACVPVIGHGATIGVIYAKIDVNALQ